MRVILINFHHPLMGLSETLRMISDRHPPHEVVYVHQRLQIDFSRDLMSQVSSVIDRVEMQLRVKGFPDGALEMASAIYIICPGLSDPTALIVMELFGRTGFFPNITLMKRDHEHGSFRAYDCVVGEYVKLNARSKRVAKGGVYETTA